jgi:hypothetical protein
MEQVLLGIVVFNAFFMPSDFQFDTLEFSQIQLEQNKNSELNVGNELKSIQGMAIGFQRIFSGHILATLWPWNLSLWA